MITTRKLNQIRKSFYVYLPQQWCRDYKLTKDSEVRIQKTPEGTLVIMPPSYEPQETGEVNFIIDEDSKDSIEGVLIGAYIVGAGKLEVEFEEKLGFRTRETISKWIRRLPGFEILEEHSKTITISDTSEKQVIAPVLRRQFATTKYMLNGLLNAMETGELGDASRIVERDQDVNRHRYFVERLCHLALQDRAYARKIAITQPDCLHFSLAAKYVERIADHICGATSELMDIQKVDKPLLKLSKELSSVYENTTRTFFSIDGITGKKMSLAKDSKEAFDTLNHAKRISVKLSKRESSKEDLGPHAVLLVMHLERIASYCEDIGEVAINRILESRIRAS